MDMLGLCHEARRRGCRPEQVCSWMVLDFEDAYYLMPLHPEERRFHCARHAGKIIIFLRTGQGAKASSLTWAHMSSLISRLTSSLFEPDEAKLQAYTDDPLLSTMAKDDLGNDMLQGIAIASWLMVGLRLAFHKGQRGRHITWIGASMALLSKRRDRDGQRQLME